MKIGTRIKRPFEGNEIIVEVGDGYAPFLEWDASTFEYVLQGWMVKICELPNGNFRTRVIKEKRRFKEGPPSGNECEQ